MNKAEEFKRIYESIQKELSYWDGKEPIEEFIKKLLIKRLMIGEEEAKNIASELLRGIIEFKKTNEFLESDKEIQDKLSKLILERGGETIINDLLNFFKIVNREVTNE